MTLATTLINVLAKHFGHIRCLSHCVGEAFQNVIFYVSEVINIIYIYNLYTKNFYILISLYVKNAFKMIFIT